MMTTRIRRHAHAGTSFQARPPAHIGYGFTKYEDSGVMRPCSCHPVERVAGRLVMLFG
jgi:hypothetical protein